MYYVTYLSKPRTRFGITEEEMKAEYERNFDKRVTKVTPTVRSFENRYKINDALTIVFNRVCDAYHLPPWRINLDMTDFSDKYETFHIPKASGGVREITAPLPDLRYAQREALKIIPKHCKFLPHNAAHGFTKNRNPKTALQVHQANKSKWFLKIDIKDFFPSCNQEFVVKQLRQIYPFCMWSDEIIKSFIWICFRNDELPQGTPLSPLITNWLMVPLDHQINKMLNSLDDNFFTYTRYADDMLISCKEKFDNNEVVSLIKEILLEMNTPFEIKDAKTRYGSKAGRNWNLGIMYNKDNNLTVGYRRKRRIKTMLFQFYQGERSWDYAVELNGELAYLKNIEPDYFNHMITAMNNKYNFNFMYEINRALKQRPE